MVGDAETSEGWHLLSEEPSLAAKPNSVFDGRKLGPIRSGSTNSISAALWIFSGHVEYQASLGKVRRLDRAQIEEVDVKPRLLGGVVVFQRRSANSIVECGFGTTGRLQEALVVLRTSGFPLSDRALAALH